MIKKFTAALLVLFFAVSIAAPALAVVDKSDEFYVADYAGVLSDETKQMIIDTNGYLETNCDGAQIVVVTIEYLDTFEYSDEYAVYLFNQWGVGDDTANNGMLLLLVTEENKGWLTTGAGISSDFTSNDADEYLNDYFWDYFDQGEYDTAVNSLFSNLVYWYEDEYGISGGFDEHYNPDPGRYKPSAFQTIVTFFIRNAWIFVFIIIIIMNMAADRRRFRNYYMGLGVPIPRYHFWYFWGGPHRSYHDHNDHNGHGGSGGGFGGFGGFGGGSGFGGGGFSGGGGGGRR